MESPQQSNEKYKFPSFEHFVVRIEQKESPRRMPYITCSASSLAGEGEQQMLDALLQGELKALLKESYIQKEIVSIEPSREFLKISWRRDNFLYFNGTYFPYRWIDTKGRNRPEREAHTLKIADKKPSIRHAAYFPRVYTDLEEWVLAVGEGGLYFPDHDNNTLMISDAIVEERPVSKEVMEGKKVELHDQIIDLHKKIFGADIEVIILPSPDGTNHLETHLSVIPKTKLVLVEHNYYQKLKKSAEIEKLTRAGYEILKIPPTKVKCPLNIYYLENSEGNIFAFLHPSIPELVKDTLREHKIKIGETSIAVAETLDEHLGGIRCITNELHTKDPAFLRKLGLKS